MHDVKQIHVRPLHDLHVAAQIDEVLLLNAQHVAVFVKNDTLSIYRSPETDHIKTQRLQVDEVRIELLLAIFIQCNGVPLTAHLFYEQLIGGQRMAEAMRQPGIVHSMHEAVLLQDLLIPVFVA